MKLSVVGLGPGDPKLISVRGSEALREADVVFVPYSSGTGRSLAIEIVKEYSLGEIVFLGFPMSEEVDEGKLKEIGNEICTKAKARSVFATLGDPVLYSTYFRVKDYINCFDQVELIPGISSITACSCKAELNLGSKDDTIAIIPSSRRDVIQLAKDKFDTIVIVKGSHELDVDAKLLSGYHITYARRCYMTGEVIAKWKEENYHRDYFSMIIAKKGEGRR
ncbi:cobalt-precorrin-2 C(20)-methyltransferase [Candidatus Acidianus copahuensis]|uniref:Cobalt-precorrin-2 C(20)-methyltransferase n=1 Tax=Candidatus Acidianus copahuensis TaxID=1160895 RepID=A0A031LT85_9CREN|nr:cobalt-factor II C(20)-methyltransferase [Candidatus Acidianus copahuensis]EZQ10699.1 cobalt-precorrin-2 C(20)-methyltransferase [Candidatus Acidianus copahuensis]